MNVKIENGSLYLVLASSDLSTAYLDKLNVPNKDIGRVVDVWKIYIDFVIKV